jgi:hypothetical protein
MEYMEQEQKKDQSDQRKAVRTSLALHLGAVTALCGRPPDA